jgi:hypothetical protein
MLECTVPELAHDHRRRLTAMRIGIAPGPGSGETLLDQLIRDDSRIGVVPPTREIRHRGWIDAGNLLRGTPDWSHRQPRQQEEMKGTA